MQAVELDSGDYFYCRICDRPMSGGNVAYFGTDETTIGKSPLCWVCKDIIPDKAAVELTKPLRGASQPVNNFLETGELTYATYVTIARIFAEAGTDERHVLRPLLAYFSRMPYRGPVSGWQQSQDV